MFLFITSTTYGQWLPGDERGYVSRDYHVVHNVPGTPVKKNNAKLKEFARRQLKGEPVLFNHEHATALLSQFQETAAYRHWKLCGAAIMSNHVHVLIEVPNTESLDGVSGNLKSYGSRRLNKDFGTPSSGTWWTSGSSVRCKSVESVPSLIEYMKGQHNPLLVWLAPEFE